MISWSISTKVSTVRDQAGIELQTPGSAVGLTTNSAMGPGVPITDFMCDPTIIDGDFVQQT